MTNRARSTLQDRLQWLESHPDMRGQTKREIVKAMKKDGLIAPTTYVFDVTLPDGWAKGK